MTSDPTKPLTTRQLINREFEAEPAAPVSPEPPLNVRLKGDKDKGRFCIHGVELIKWCKICDGAGTVASEPPRCPKCSSPDKDTHYAPDAPWPQSENPCPHPFHGGAGTVGATPEQANKLLHRVLARAVSSAPNSDPELMEDIGRYLLEARSLPSPVGATPETTAETFARRYWPGKRPDVMYDRDWYEFAEAYAAASLPSPAPQDAADQECICKGNWRNIVKRMEPLINQDFRDDQGREFRLFGIVDGGDDYYYGMYSKEHGMRLLSCVGDLDSWDLKLAASPACSPLGRQTRSTEL